MQRLDEQADQSCEVKIKDTKASTFKNPQRAITHGQSVVLYQNICLGGGKLRKFIRYN